MKRLLFAAALALAAATASALAADVGISVTIGEPGFYGRLDIGDFPQPQVIYVRPIVIEQVPTDRPPIYLRVPSGHAKHWSKHCREYNACGERVLFVRDDWYNREYVPRYQARHRDHRDDYRGDHGNDRHGDDPRQGPESLRHLGINYPGSCLRNGARGMRSSSPPGGVMAQA